MKEKNAIYVGKVTRLDNFEQKRCTGLHEGPFKGKFKCRNTKSIHVTYPWECREGKVQGG